MFRNYHYLNGSLGAGVRCYCAIYRNKPIAFVAVVTVRMKGRYYRVSRLVVLPDYQGIGVGKGLLNFVAELYTSQLNLPFYIVTSNPQLVRGNLDRWKIKRIGHGSHGREDTRINREISETNCRQRLSVSLEYILQNAHRKEKEVLQLNNDQRVDLSLPNSLRGKHCRECKKKISRGNKSGYCKICRGRFVLRPAGHSALKNSITTKAVV
jgi:hypothetical protein